MSSTTYSAFLDADDRLRQRVILAGVALAAIGVLVIGTLPLGVWVRGAMTAGWLLYAGRDLTRYARGYGRYRRLVIDQNLRLRLLGVDGNWRKARVLPGSVVLRRYAWLRVRDDAGLVFAEPVSGRARTDREWRRLQVIWRHVGAAR